MPRAIHQLGRLLRRCCGLFMLLLAGLAIGLLAGCQPQAVSRQDRPSAGLESAVTAVDAEPAVSSTDPPPADGSVASASAGDPAGAKPGASPVERPAEPVAVPASSADGDSLHIISFEDLKVDIQADSVFEPSMLTDRVRELDGRRVRIRGFIFPAVFQQTGIDRFLLVMNTECKFGPGEEAHHIIIVELVDGVTTSFTVRPITVDGRLSVKPWKGPDGNTWALYHMEGERVR